MQQTVFTNGETENFQVEVDSANSTHLLTPDGENWMAVSVFEKPWSPPHNTPLHIPEPVRVIKNGEAEEMIYNSSVMELGKIYQVRWKGRMYGLRKTESEVEILRFYPDGD